MSLNNSSVFFSTVWAIAETVAILIGGFRVYFKLIKKLDRIEYALYNDGRSGLVQQVGELHDNQQVIKTDIEVMKAKMEHKPTRTRKSA